MFYVHIKANGDLTMQPQEYIEDGWFIDIDTIDANTQVISLYEIPMGGGEPQLVSTFETLSAAIDMALQLS